MTSLKSGDYNSVFGGLYSLNGLLPDTVDDEEPNKLKYRVVISDYEYEKLTKHTIYAECYQCGEKDILFEKIPKFQIDCGFVGTLVSQVKQEEAWQCPKCHKFNILRITRDKDLIAETTLKEPFFLGVVPKPPTRLDGVSDRTQFHAKMVRWAWTFLNELEAKMTQFRDDNWTKNEQMSFSDDVEDGGEEND